MPNVADLRDENRDLAIPPAAARYVQLPTLVMDIMKDYFSQTEQRWLPSVGHLKYYGQAAVDAITQITNAVEIFRFEEQRGDKHTSQPKLLVKRGAVAISGMGIGDSTRQGIPSSNGVQRALQYAGAVTVFGMSKAYGESEHLAADCEQLLNHFAGHFRRRFGLRRYSVSQVGDVGMLKQFPHFFATPIVVDYIYEDNIELFSNTFPIRSIVLDIE